MKENIFIGADGGGSKILLRIENEAGDFLGMGRAGPAQINLSVDQAYQSVYAALDIALNEAGLSLQDQRYNFHAGFGLAGCEIKSAVEDFLTRDHHFKSIKLFSDAHAACVGAHAGSDGAIIIIGTGVIGFQIYHGKQFQVGGWGFPHDDLGGGAWLGKELIKLTLQWHDGRHQQSPMFVQVLSQFNDDIGELVKWANNTNPTGFATMAPIVIKHIELNDPCAVRLIKDAAQHVDAIALALNKASPENEIIPLSLFGGIAIFIKPWLSYNIRKTIVPRQFDASHGALLLIRDYVDTLQNQ